MMIRAAGGPGSVSPLDFNERKQPLPRTTWIAIGVVAAAHVAVGLVLYYQRFEMAVQAPADPGDRPITLTFDPPPKPPVVQPTPKTPVAPNPIHKTPAPASPTDTLPADTSDPHPTDGVTISITHTPPDPVKVAPSATVAPEPLAAITNPSWLRQPNADQMMRAYPNRAITAGVSGSATLNCGVRADGSVGDCAVVSETPGDYGFGRAAQGLSRYFRINPRTVNGAAVDGARVSISLRFTLPKD